MSLPDLLPVDRIGMAELIMPLLYDGFARAPTMLLLYAVHGLSYTEGNYYTRGG